MKRDLARREFLRWVAGSSMLGPVAASSLSCAASRPRVTEADVARALNVFELERLAAQRLGDDAFAYLAGGADDLATVRANRAAYGQLQLRARRLVDVSRVDTRVELFGELLGSPLLLAPVGFQAFFDPEGELATARAAATQGQRMIASSASCFSVGEIARAGGTAPWFQLYPTENREVTRTLLARAEQAGCRVVALTIDAPVLGNRERHSTTLNRLLQGGQLRMGNFEGVAAFESILDASMDWDMVAWLKANTRMHVVLKGIVTREDAALAVRHGAGGMIVSNHGGRQLESHRSTLAALPEIVDEVAGRLPVLIDGGIRRGTDVFKALALGADAVCIGRPYCWGLAALGQPGVEKALELLQAELVRTMQIAGAPALAAITRDFIA